MNAKLGASHEAVGVVRRRQRVWMSLSIVLAAAAIASVLGLSLSYQSLSSASSHHCLTMALVRSLWVNTIVSLVAAMLCVVALCRKTLLPWEMEDRKARSLTWAFSSAVAVAVAVILLVGASSTSCALAPSSSRWVKSTTVAYSLALLLFGAVGLVGAILAMVERHAEGQESVPALVCLRCSCCSAAFKRLLVLSPFAALFGWNLASTLQTYQASCPSELSTYYIGVTATFGVMLLGIVMQWCCRSGWSSKRRRETAASEISRKRQRTALAICLVIVGVFSLAWGIGACVWLTPSAVSMAAGSPRACPQQLVDDMRVSATQLCLVGSVIVTMSLCCRLEDFFLPARTSVPSTITSPRPTAHTVV